VDDKLFNGFSYTALAGAPLPGQVNANLDANAGTLTYGWTFTSASGSFQGNFILTYTVTVLTAGSGSCAACLITSSQEQIFAGNPPPGPVTVSVAETAGISPIIVSNASFGNNTNGDAFTGVLSLTETATTSAITSLVPLLSFESDVRQTSVSSVPEPATFGLIGISLLSLGLLRRRSSKNKQLGV
jgi:hypothetical protein